ncbi:hypothetical protein ACWEIJ_17500 [Lentzea sp. NPDC004789]
MYFREARRDQPFLGLVVRVFSGGDHGQDGVAVPGAPAAHLVLVEADGALAGLEAGLD